MISAVSSLNGLLASTQELVWAMALLTSPPHTDPGQVLDRLEQAQGLLQQIDRGQLQSLDPKVTVAFSRDLELPLPSPQPPRELQPLSWDESLKATSDLVQDLSLACHMWSGWQRKQSWARLRVSADISLASDLRIS